MSTSKNVDLRPHLQNARFDFLLDHMNKILRKIIKEWRGICWKVEFYIKRKYYIPDDYSNIGEAFKKVKPGGIIILKPIIKAK